ncbi:unnamed protein product [Protopolystoma xenopodis]|uniref:Protein tweety homolog n=1 Tax=Protopolystoma xenopodis TaxID=117903 RepID=A0A448WDL6_9PLAT|nr:unnamed protein product [Protopolystoma xenopodis]
MDVFYKGLCLLIVLIIFGRGVHSETYWTPAGQSEWLSNLQENSLSWSYGIAACALLCLLCALTILSWCVYPRRIVA